MPVDKCRTSGIPQARASSHDLKISLFSSRTQGAITPRILIADDHDIVRRGVRHILETQDDWEVVGEAADSREAILLNRQLKPEAIVMHITMPVMNGLDATRQIVKVNPNCKVLVLTMHEGRGLWTSIQRSGAKGLISKSQAGTELTSALKAIIAGKHLLPLIRLTNINRVRGLHDSSRSLLSHLDEMAHISASHRFGQAYPFTDTDGKPCQTYCAPLDWHRSPTDG